MSAKEIMEYNGIYDDNDEEKIFSLYFQRNSNLSFYTSDCQSILDSNQVLNAFEVTRKDTESLTELNETKSHESLETIISYDDKEPSIPESDLDSPICLAELKVSDSKLKIFNELYPIPEDPGLESSFWTLYSLPQQYNDDGIEKFINLTQAMKLQPIQRIPDMLKTDELNLKYYGLDPRIMRAICEALFNNPFVKIVDLTGNWLSVDACFHLDELLSYNNILTHLNLSGCEIGSRGAKRIEESIGRARSLEYLNVSRCDLGYEGFKSISMGIYSSSSIKVVDFSHNNLGENTADDFQTMLTQTDTLKELNLSWNELFSEAFWKKFVAGLLRNNSLLELDLSWNNLGPECLPFLQKYLLNTTMLSKLNIKNNRFGPEEAEKIGKFLIKNKTLEILNLGSNQIKTEGAFAFINSLKIIPVDSKLQLIDLENIWANKEVIPLIETIKEKLPQMNIKLEGILSNYKLIGPNLRKIFLRRAGFEAMKPKKMRLKRDFGQFIMTLDEAIITEDDFKNAVKRYKLNLSESLVTEIINVFKIGDNAVDQSALKTFYLKEYPDTQPAPPMKDKKNTKKKRKS